MHRFGLTIAALAVTFLVIGPARADAPAAADHGMPEVTFAVVNESRDNWMIVVDGATTGEQLKQRLIRAVRSRNARAAEPPADATEGYRFVSHAVLAGVVGVGK